MLNFQFQGNRKLRDELTSSRLNAILTELRRIRPVAGRGINVQQEPNGTRISALDSFVSAGGGASTSRQPWDIYVSATEGEGEEISYTLKVQPGLAGFFLATNWDDEWNADYDELVYGILSVETDGQFITGLTIDISSDPPSPQEPQKFGLEDTIDLLFGMFKNGKQYNFTSGVNINLAARAVLAVSADPPAQPGESVFDIYYSL
jgi:hypothetical protein